MCASALTYSLAGPRHASVPRAPRGAAPRSKRIAAPRPSQKAALAKHTVGGEEGRLRAIIERCSAADKKARRTQLGRRLCTRAFRQLADEAIVDRLRAILEEALGYVPGPSCKIDWLSAYSAKRQRDEDLDGIDTSNVIVSQGRPRRRCTVEDDELFGRASDPEAHTNKRLRRASETTDSDAAFSDDEIHASAPGLLSASGPPAPRSPVASLPSSAAASGGSEDSEPSEAGSTSASPSGSPP